MEILVYQLLGINDYVIILYKCTFSVASIFFKLYDNVKLTNQCSSNIIDV